MLTIITTLKTFRISREVFEFHFGAPLTNYHVMDLGASHGRVEELMAALEGRPYSASLLSDLGYVLLADPDNQGSFFDGKDTSFAVRCSDGDVVFDDYTKECMARHFLLIRGFIETHPNENSISINCPMVDVIDVVHSVIDIDTRILTPSVKYALQLLTPVTDLYYLLFDLSQTSNDFIVSILEKLTDEERYELLRSYRLTQRFNNNTEYLDLPQEGRGLKIGFALPRVLEVAVKRPIPGLTDDCPSFIFLSSYAFTLPDSLRKTLLFSSTFNDDSGVLVEEIYNQLIEYLITMAIAVCDWKECCTILYMLGVRHETVRDKVEGSPSAPYQVILRRGSLTMKWSLIESTVKDKPDFNVSLLADILGPFSA